MKHLKMLGLAAIAALGLMAFAGAGTASATTLSTDAAGTIKYAVGTQVHATLVPGSSALLEKTNGEIIDTCLESTVKGDMEDPSVVTNGVAYPSGTWVTGQITTITFDRCTNATTTTSLGSLEIMKTGADEGEVRGKGSNVTISVFGVSCTYGTGEGTVLGSIKGGAAPVLKISAPLNRSAGNTLLCPSTGIWTAEYVVTEPHELHIVE